MQVGAVLHDVRILRPRLRVGAVVDEEHPTAGCQARADQRPERGEAGPRHMRQPEREEHHVVGPRRFPLEQVGDHVLDIGAPNAFTVEGERLGRGVDHREMIRRLGEPCGPPPRAAGQLQHVTRRTERRQRRLDDDHLFVPLAGLALSPVVAALT